MPRKLSIVALAIVGLHIVEVLTLGESPAGAVVGNLLQLTASFLTVTMCLRASRRAGGFVRTFWIMVGAGIGFWGVANLGWMYYEVALHREPPELSFVRFLFDAQQAFSAVAILHDPDQRSKGLDFGS